MTQEVFADGIGEITVTGPTVRLDLVSLSPSERDADNNPKPVFRQRIVMPIEAFMNAFDLMERVAKELVDSGAVRRRAPNGEAAQAAPAQPRPSPNFS
jgi:hypothetical protein